MDWVSSFDEKINAVIDFAHNKLSFETLFDYLKKEYPQKGIVVVFGCSGEKSYEATATGIGEDGCLIVQLPDGGQRTVSSGEASVRGLFGYL